MKEEKCKYALCFGFPEEDLDKNEPKIKNCLLILSSTERKDQKNKTQLEIHPYKGCLSPN